MNQPNEQVLQYAELAYRDSNYLLTLQELGKQYKNLEASDIYYWAYLSLNGDPEHNNAQNGYVFYPTYKDESDRQIGNDDITQTTILQEAIPIKNTSRNNVSIVPPLIQGPFRVFGYDYFLSSNRDDSDKYLSTLLTKDNIFQLFNKIMSNDGVVLAGGLPSRCIYQKWSLNPTLQDVLDHKPMYGTTFKLPKEKYDIDLFIFDQNPNDIVRIVNTIKQITREYDPDSTWFESNGAIYTIINGISIQIIKRLYKTINEILLGFDLDSSACAFYQNQFLVHRRFRDAVTYGQNIINPMRQSKCYDYRLNKYLHRGFTILVPADLNTYTQQKCLNEKLNNIIQMNPKSKLPLSDYITIFTDWEFTLPGVVMSYNNSIIFNEINLQNWRVRSPTSQITGTFNPTKNDYLGCLFYNYLTGETEVSTNFTILNYILEFIGVRIIHDYLNLNSNNLNQAYYEYMVLGTPLMTILSLGTIGSIDENTIKSKINRLFTRYKSRFFKTGSLKSNESRRTRERTEELEEMEEMEETEELRGTRERTEEMEESRQVKRLRQIYFLGYY